MEMRDPQRSPSAYNKLDLTLTDPIFLLLTSTNSTVCLHQSVVTLNNNCNTSADTFIRCLYSRCVCTTANLDLAQRKSTFEIHSGLRVELQPADLLDVV